MKNLIPQFIHRQFAHQNNAGHMQAAAMFVDISGFTRLTATLMRHATDGAEVLAVALNRIFSPPVAEVYARGGFITSFAGDAFTALFPCAGPPNIPTAAVLQTALFIQEFFAQHGRLATKYGTFEMGVKIGLARGAVDWGILGDKKRYTYFFRGPAINACARAEQQAATGDIWPAIQNCVKAQALNGVPTYFRLTDCSATAIRSTPDSAPTRSGLTRQMLNPFVLDAVLDMVASGSQAEFRRIASVFISFEEPRAPAELSTFVTTAMDVATDYGGYFNKLDFGDKGPVLLILFGAPAAHENDFARAANFLLTLRSSLATESPLRFRAGLTFGTVYAGLIGGAERCEFTAIGNVVNFAARLMQKARWGQTLVPDAVTAQHRLIVDHIGDFRYKGFRAPQPTYQLLGVKTDQEDFFDQPMIGRATELEQLLVAAPSLFTGQFAGVAVIYGEAGIGKSYLAYELRQRLTPPALLPAGGETQEKIVWFTGQTDQVLRRAFNPFVYFLKRYFNQQPEATPAENQARFDERLTRLTTALAATPQPDSPDLAPTATARARVADLVAELTRARSMLGALIGLHWPHSLYASLDAKLRYQNTLFAIKTLLLAESHLHPVVLLIEDLQWLDDSSHAALSTLTRNVGAYPLFVVLTSRYADDGSRPTLALSDDVPLVTVDLNTLARADLRRLSNIILGGPASDDLLTLLQARTQSNPFFAQQFLYYFRENDLLEQVPDTEEWSLKSNIPAEVPTTINAILIARVDRLEQRVKNVVKGAAVLGREFDDRVLARMLQAEVALEVRAAEREQIWSEVR